MHGCCSQSPCACHHDAVRWGGGGREGGQGQRNNGSGLLSRMHGCLTLLDSMVLCCQQPSGKSNALVVWCGVGCGRCQRSMRAVQIGLLEG
jgi:hypothetical protein